MALQHSVVANPTLQQRQKHPTNNLANLHNVKPLKLAYPLTSSTFTCSQQHEYSISPFPPVNKSVAAVIFGDGSESRLYPLTKRRSEGAIPIAGNYRLIDVVVSNCINSDITKIYALTQFNSTSLNSHLSRAYCGVNLGKERFVEVIAAYQSPVDQGWFQGNADAVRRCLWVLEEFPITEYFLLPGHHLYRMDYRKIVETHRKSKADITIMGLEATGDHDPGFGFLKVNNENRVLEFKEKCNTDLSYENVVHNAVDFVTIPSTGIYLINRDIMKQLLIEYFPKANDFGSEVIQGAISMGIKVQAHLFGGYWEDMRSIKAFYQANMENTRKSNTGFNFHDREFPVYTRPRSMPPSIVTDAVIIDSVIGDGCILKGCKIKGTVVGLWTRIDEGAVIEDSLIMGSDIHQMDNEMNVEERKGRCIPIGIGKNVLVRNAIIDKNARIGSNMMIINRDKVQEGDREADGYMIIDGIVVILRSAVIPDGSVI